MRHIPEEELHAYLDQALSRSQCVEIECHLAECRRCRADRERVAAARDRVTALLADASPHRVRHVAFDSIVKRHHARISTRRSVVRWGGLTAGLAAAIATFALWGHQPSTKVLSDNPGNLLTIREPTGDLAIPATIDQSDGVDTRSLFATGPVRRALNGKVIPSPLGRSQSAGMQVSASTELTNAGDLGFAKVASFQESATDLLPFDGGMWAPVSLEQAAEETGGRIPKVKGLSIVEIQLLRGGPNERPMVVVVQQSKTGKLVKTVEGPIDKVHQLLEKSAKDTTFNASAPEFTPPDYRTDGPVSRGIRVMSVTGSLPVEALNVMVSTIEMK